MAHHSSHIEQDSGYLDPDDDMQVSDSLQSSIYSKDDVPQPQSTGQSYNPNQFQRTQSNFNNNLLHSHNDFTDIHTLQVGESQDDGNWDETTSYNVDFKSYCQRYSTHAITIFVILVVAILFLIGFFIGLVIHSTPLIIICLVVAALLAAGGGWFSYKFYHCYKKRIPFTFQG